MDVFYAASVCSFCVFQWSAAINSTSEDEIIFYRTIGRQKNIKINFSAKKNVVYFDPERELDLYAV